MQQNSSVKCVAKAHASIVLLKSHYDTISFRNIYLSMASAAQHNKHA